MPELLLELLSEEIPARMQARAADDLKRLVCDGLKKEGLAFESAEAYVTPRRLTLVVDGLPEKTEDSTDERKGPQVGAPDKAIEGFLKSAGFDSLDQCEIRDVKGKQVYFAVSERKGQPASLVLELVLISAITDLNWPKSMRWANTRFSYVRPLHRVLSLFNGNVVSPVMELDKKTTLSFSDQTHGHRFLSDKPITVKNFADYKQKLFTAKVMLDPAERRAKILKDAEALAKSETLTLKPDEGLLTEVAGLVEWPVALMGSIDEAFMDLPDEVLSTSMRTHQKYFSLLNGDGTLAPKFIVVANTEASDDGKAITAGNERVLRARLADARHFWDQDRRHSLESHLPALEKIVFHAKLGTVAEKISRMQALVQELAWCIPGVDTALAERAALLCKCDLVSEMVYEFPELQGIMGRYYALHEGARAEVAAAIADHYSPAGPNDDCPSAPASIAVALADKFDTLVGFWAIDEKPTGSKDPFALRRAALGVIRLIVENGLRVPLLKMFDKARDGLPDGFDGNDLLTFFADRLKVHLREKGVKHDHIDAVFALGGEDDLVRLLARVDALGEFLATEDGANLLTAYKRAANILRIEEKKDKVTYDGAVDDGLLDQNEERALAKSLGEMDGKVAPALEKENFAAAMSGLAALRGPVDAFFDHVTVNCDDDKLRGNRLRLLSGIRAAMDGIADFSKIEG